MRRITLGIATGAAAIGSLFMTAAPASAARQEGLVNVNVSDTTVQVPIAAAVNICDLNVAALAEVIALDGSCDAAADANATDTGGRSGNPHQDGLVNVNLTNTTIQVPAAVAANICDVNIAVLATLVDVPGASCDAQADSNANA